MKRNEICKHLLTVTRQITVKNGDTVSSSGSGVVISERGLVLTANHVVINSKTGAAYPGRIFVREDKKAPLEYRSTVAGLSITGIPGMRTLILDFALLVPIDEVSVSCIELREKMLEVGDEVIFSGFPDDLELPFGFHQKIDTVEMTGVQRKEVANFLRYEMRRPFFRCAMVGCLTMIKLNLDASPTSMAEYWLDNASTPGMSGGPVVDDEGKLVGIICKRGLTEVDTSNPSPANTALVVSHHFVNSEFANKMLGTDSLTPSIVPAAPSP